MSSARVTAEPQELQGGGSLNLEAGKTYDLEFQGPGYMKVYKIPGTDPDPTAATVQGVDVVWPQDKLRITRTANDAVWIWSLLEWGGQVIATEVETGGGGQSLTYTSLYNGTVNYQGGDYVKEVTLSESWRTFDLLSVQIQGDDRSYIDEVFSVRHLKLWNNSDRMTLSQRWTSDTNDTKPKVIRGSGPDGSGQAMVIGPGNGDTKLRLSGAFIPAGAVATRIAGFKWS